jgi:gliding motility-associated-like protein
MGFWRNHHRCGYIRYKKSILNVGLIVTNSKGCIDTVHQDYTVRDKPLLNLPFRDTLICSIDSLLIHVSNPGIYSWKPNKNILFANTADPIVFPKDTTRYIVSLADNGCINTDTVTVNVLQFIKVDLGNDTLICKTDTIRLNPVSYALGYKWTSSSGVLISNIKRPLVQPLVNTKYYVTANLGKCEDKDSIQLKVVPYPVAIVGPDTTICLGSRIQLRSTVVGSSYSWTPANSLVNASVFSPIAGPSKTTVYVLKVSDTLGCPKPSSDTILVTVAPKIIANAGRDTVALPGQPLQLEATGGQNYLWTPEIFLSNINIPNPIATLDANIDSIKYKVKVLDANGCFSEDDIVIRVYKTGPDIFVPSAFTPNGDGKNDVLKPYTVGISKLSYFNVYNRWGQLVFTTTELGKGWDGIFNGNPQPANAYVFSTEGTDYTGKTVYRKGTTVLIR